MQKPTTPIKTLLLFAQLFDSSFPSGSFVHSFGLEAHVLSGKINNAQELKDFLLNLIFNQYISFEFVHVKKVYHALCRDNFLKLTKLDTDFTSYLTYAYAKALQDAGANYLAHVQDMLSLQEYNVFKVNNISDISLLSFLAFRHKFVYRDFCLLWAKKNLLGIANCVPKIARIKPSCVQKVLLTIDETLENIDFCDIAKEISNFNPLFEEVIFSHKSLQPKMFVT